MVKRFSIVDLNLSISLNQDICIKNKFLCIDRSSICYFLTDRIEHLETGMYLGIPCIGYQFIRFYQGSKELSDKFQEFSQVNQTPNFHSTFHHGLAIYLLANIASFHDPREIQDPTYSVIRVIVEDRSSDDRVTLFYRSFSRTKKKKKKL